MSQTTRLALSLFLAALILGVAGDILLRPTPWGINRLAGLICFALIAYQVVQGRVRVATLTEYAH